MATNRPQNAAEAPGLRKPLTKSHVQKIPLQIQSFDGSRALGVVNGWSARPEACHVQQYPSLRMTASGNDRFWDGMFSSLTASQRIRPGIWRGIGDASRHCEGKALRLEASGSAAVLSLPRRKIIGQTSSRGSRGQLASSNHLSSHPIP